MAKYVIIVSLPTWNIVKQNNTTLYACRAASLTGLNFLKHKKISDNDNLSKYWLILLTYDVRYKIKITHNKGE